MWATDTIWFDATIVLGIFAFGNVFFGHFEEHRPKLRRVLKVVLVLGIALTLSATIGRLIRDIQRRLGVTAVVVTHDLPLARRVGDRLAFLADGRFRFLGTWAEAEASDDPVLTGFLAGRDEE